MNKKLVDELLPSAVDVLKTVQIEKKVGNDTKVFKIVNNGVIDKTFRGYISSFGAAVSAGTLLSAVAFFSDKSGAKGERPLLMMAINEMLKRNMLIPEDELGEKLFNSVRNASSQRKMKESVLACAVALKLAMNLFDLKSGNERKEGSPLESAL